MFAHLIISSNTGEYRIFHRSVLYCMDKWTRKIDYRPDVIHV